MEANHEADMNGIYCLETVWFDEEFKDRTGVTCVSGYTKDVDSNMAWAFELMYLDELARKNFGNRETLLTLQRHLHDKRAYAGLADELGFRMLV